MLVERLIGSARVAAEGEAAIRLAELCGHLSLALRIAVAHLAVEPGLPIVEYVRDLAAADASLALS